MTPRSRCPFRRLALVAAVALSLVGPASVLAQNTVPARSDAATLAKYDANKNGVLDASELAAKEADDAKARAAGEAGVPDDVSRLSTFTVTETQDIGYESMQTTSGMRTVQELKNLANSISILNAQLIEDTASLTIDEMMRWSVSGEDNPEPLNVQVDSRVILRGVANAYAMRNGWIWYSPMDAYSTERVEVLRGPNAFLYGEADVGGAQNQMTKRGLFTRKINKLKLMLGNDGLRRAEIDVNRPLIKDKLAVRLSMVQSHNDSWIDNVRRDFAGIYAAVTYRPFPNTMINVMAEHAETNTVNSQGLFTDSYSRTATAAIVAAGGFVYVPATGLGYRAFGTGRVNSTGSATAVIDEAILPRSFHSGGPNAQFENYYQSITIEAEHHIGKNLHLQLSGNFYQRNIDQQAIGAGRSVFRDVNRTLPNGAANPYFNELYTEYFRTRREHGNIVKDIRFSAVYDINTKWMKQQLLANVQQHQDNPYHRKPAWGEYLDEANPAFSGVINRDITQAAFTANRTTFTNNRFMRRYYFQRDGMRGSDDMGPVPGVSAWYPDLSNAVGAAGHQLYRRFYTPSWGVGASGTYFNNHLFTHVGYREDQFKMKTRFSTVRPLKNQWVVDEIPGLFPANQLFVLAKVHGANYGAVVRVNDAFAIGYNFAQSFRISTGEGADTHRVGEKQGVPVGEGTDISARLSLFKGANGIPRLELNVVKYDNFRPNDRFNPNPTVQVENEVSAIFPENFNPIGQDFQTTSTTGYEFDMTTNITRNWRLTFNWSTNKVVTKDRAPILHEFQAAAKAQNRPTPLLDAFLATFPEGVPNAGYTKERANMFTRYTFVEGALRGLYIGGGVNFRLRTYRGIGDHDMNVATPTADMWSPAYSLYSFLAGYNRRIYNRPVTFAINVSNVFDKEYYRSGGIATGSWGDPRGFRFTMSTEF
jgi:outer membrane receptor protein involved in Fe transport